MTIELSKTLLKAAENTVNQAGFSGIAEIKGFPSMYIAKGSNSREGLLCISVVEFGEEQFYILQQW